MILHAVYATYQTEKGHNRARMIYDYLTRDYMQPINLEAVFRIGPEEHTGISDFIEEWRQFLLDTTGDQAATLLLEACLYQDDLDHLVETAHVGYKQHPILYLNACAQLLEREAFSMCETVGLSALNVLPENLIIRGEIANLTRAAAAKLAHQDIVDQCYKAAFQSESTLTNFFNLCHLPESKENIQAVATYVTQLPEQEVFDRDNNHQQWKTNDLSQKNKDILHFFSGKFDDIYEQCQTDKEPLGWGHDLKEVVVPLFILLLNQDNNLSKVQQLLSSRIIYQLEYKDTAENFLADVALWKHHVTIEKEAVNRYISWLKEEVDKKTETIVGEGHRKSYDKAALLIAALAETLVSHGLINSKDTLLDHYKQVHSRKTAFKRECDALK
ncbi:hypothetical protein SAMN05421668_12433 [Halolactibacillus miurensis]|uniref:Uncharacterized protein n=1 Tax=Halolactibacillus miurensis TaxID=306541 RepID=A0A1I6UBT7_9BACI|nr:hypothetical protein SAMN05421668_12433 [Halolactibacillus miurensis]